MYNVVFFFQIQLSNSCLTLFGNTFGCNILNPDYIFTNVIINTIYWSIFLYFILKTYEAWILWNKYKNKKRRRPK